MAKNKSKASAKGKIPSDAINELQPTSLPSASLAMSSGGTPSAADSPPPMCQYESEDGLIHAIPHDPKLFPTWELPTAPEYDDFLPLLQNLGGKKLGLDLITSLSKPPFEFNGAFSPLDWRSTFASRVHALAGMPSPAILSDPAALANDLKERESLTRFLEAGINVALGQTSTLCGTLLFMQLASPAELTKVKDDQERLMTDATIKHSEEIARLNNEFSVVRKQLDEVRKTLGFAESEKKEMEERHRLAAGKASKELRDALDKRNKAEAKYKRQAESHGREMESWAAAAAAADRRRAKEEEEAKTAKHESTEATKFSLKFKEMETEIAAHLARIETLETDRKKDLAKITTLEKEKGDQERTIQSLMDQAAATTASIQGVSEVTSDLAPRVDTIEKALTGVRVSSKKILLHANRPCRRMRKQWARFCCARCSTPPAMTLLGFPEKSKELPRRTKLVMTSGSSLFTLTGPA